MLIYMCSFWTYYYHSQVIQKLLNVEEIFCLCMYVIGIPIQYHYRAIYGNALLTLLIAKLSRIIECSES